MNQNLVKVAQEMGLLHVVHVGDKPKQEIGRDDVQCPHCGEVSHIGGLIGPTTDDCPRCGKTVLGE